jgi:hypothetical protein
LQPPVPAAQSEAAGRAFDYPTGYNLTIRPREYEPITFEQMRALADGYDLLRLVIETRKDQIEKLDFRIRKRSAGAGEPGDDASTGEDDPRIDTINNFLRCPDGEHPWQTWLRMLLEDMLVIDAATIYPRLNRGGRLAALELIDGATIKHVLDDAGRTPAPPDPAYQQVLKGLPAVDYSRDELLYLPRRRIRTAI